MAIRTTAAAVEAVLVDDYDGVTSLDTAIETANSVVDRIAAIVADWAAADQPSDANLELVERWLAAHFYATSDRPFQAARTGDASGTFQGKTKLYLDATYYGQTAIVVDASRLLKQITEQERKTAAVVWVGKKPSERINLSQRS